MPTYLVEAEVHTKRRYEVEADTPEDARAAVGQGVYLRKWDAPDVCEAVRVCKTVAQEG